jgi:hypothetical protein
MTRVVAFSLFAVLIGVGGTLACQSYRDEIAQTLPFRWLFPIATMKAPAPAVSAADLQEQLKPLAIDIALVRRSIELLGSNLDQLARKQDQLAQYVSTLQGADTKVSALPLPPKTIYAPPPPPNSLLPPAQ